MRTGKPPTIVFLLALEIGKSMLEPGDGADRRRGDGKLYLMLGAGAQQHGGVVEAVLTEPLTGEF